MSAASKKRRAARRAPVCGHCQLRHRDHSRCGRLLVHDYRREHAEAVARRHPK